MKRLNELVGARVTTAREKANMTQVEFGKLIGITRVSVSNIENGRQALTLDNIYKMAFALDVDPSYFLVEKAMLVEGIDESLAAMERIGIDSTKAKAFLMSQLITEK